MQIAITGATGLIGSALAASLSADGHRVVPVSRRPQSGGITWDPARGVCDATALAGTDAVAHLAGENLAAGRWTEARKTRIRESRVRGTTTLATAIARMDHPPAVLVSASAVGYYGCRHGDEWLDEAAPAGDDFLARTCVAWEAAADPARRAGIRVVHPRFAMVLAAQGGALAKMLPPFRLGLGGRLGSGRQWMSWIAIADVVAGLRHAVTCAALAGPVNFAAPEPVRNAAFTRALGAALHRPALFAIPASVLGVAFGELAQATLLASQRVSPTRLAASGFAFRHPGLAGALRAVLDGG